MTAPSIKTNIYIDGFNLYYGALKGSPYRWLDVKRLCELSLHPKHVINRIVSALGINPRTVFRYLEITCTHPTNWQSHSASIWRRTKSWGLHPHEWLGT